MTTAALSNPIPNTTLLRQTIPGFDWTPETHKYYAVSKQADAQGKALGVELVDFRLDPQDANKIEPWNKREFDRTQFDVIA